MTEQQQTGVTEEAAAPHAEPQEAEQSNREVNWNAAQQTMAEQKQALAVAQQQNQTYQQQINVFQNYMDQQQQQKAAQPEVNAFENISDDDVVTGGDMKRALGSVLSEKEKQFQQQLKKQESQMALMSMRAQHSDYDQVVGNALEMAKNNPALAQAMQSSSNPGLLAYQIGKGNTQVSEQAAAAKKIVENAQKPGSASHAATGGSALSKVDYFMDMSEQDFEKHIAGVKHGG